MYSNNDNSIEKIYILQPVLDEKDKDIKLIHDETISLIESAGALYCGSFFAKIREIYPATYIGSGNLEKIKYRLENLNVTVLFNGVLSPSQTLNLSRTFGDCKVIDRTTLILAIFAKNAKSSEGKLQVELAQLKYMYPRLKGKGEGLSRLGGGIGTRGPGESKLETDRRRIRVRLSYLENKLNELSTRRNLISERRKKSNVPVISLIGYTNTGKSTLLNLLTGANVQAENKLFATLDPTTRSFVIDNTTFLLTDTVGFLRELPHHLISAFHSTLESALDCDLALIVCDATADYEMQLETTMKTLDALNFNVPHLIVMNKSENIINFDEYPSNSIFVSAKNNIGIERLKSEILHFFSAFNTDTELFIPYTKYHDYSKLKKYLNEISYQYLDDGIKVFVRVPNIHMFRFEQFRVVH